MHQLVRCNSVTHSDSVSYCCFKLQLKQTLTATETCLPLVCLQEQSPTAVELVASHAASGVFQASATSVHLRQHHKQHTSTAEWLTAKSFMKGTSISNYSKKKYFMHCTAAIANKIPKHRHAQLHIYYKIIAWNVFFIENKNSIHGYTKNSNMLQFRKKHPRCYLLTFPTEAKFVPERDYNTFGYLLLVIHLSVCRL